MSDLFPEAAKTSRGFEIIKFQDANAAECSIQQSSAIGDFEGAYDHPGSSYLWLGVSEAIPKVLVPGQGWVAVELSEDSMTTGRMHLHRDQVRDLIPILIRWLETGKLSATAG